MAANAYQVDDALFQALLKAYRERCGSSPSTLINGLNQTYSKELSMLRNKKGSSKVRDLISDKTIRNFFNPRHPNRLVEKNLNFLCRYLLDFPSYRDATRYYQESSSSEPASSLSTLRTLLNKSWTEPYVSYFVKKYGTVRIPNMTSPTAIDSVYTESMLSEDLRIRKRKSLLELQAEMELADIKTKSRIAVSDVFNEYERLMVWGPAGSGKTTSLKFYAIRAAEMLQTKPNEYSVPVFIECSRFSSADAETNLFKVISSKLEHGNISQKESHILTKRLLKSGQCIILLDGLDEVPKDIRPEICKKFDVLVNQYPDNRFILTCRYGATDFVPDNFTEVEVTDFDQGQINTFVKSWFKENSEKGVIQRFLLYLEEHQNIGDLAKNPLLLTMLCSIYEQGYEFPKGKSSLFEDATDLYLRKWDSYRRIDHRDKIYDGLLSRPKRRDFFCRLAYDGMTRQDESKSFWRRPELEAFIKDYILNLKDAKEASLDDDAHQILDALESQDSLLTRSAHEVYTFSYEGFLSYFTAMRVKEEMASEPYSWEQFLQKYALQPEWRECFLFAVEQLSEANMFLVCLFKLMQRQLDVVSQAGEQRLIEVFRWLEQSTDLAVVSSSAWRACFLWFDFVTDLRISRRTQGMDLKLMRSVAIKLRQINDHVGKLTPRTERAALSLDLAVIHTLVMDRADNIVTTIDEIGMWKDYDDRYQAAQQEFPNKFLKTIGLAEKITPDLAEQLRHLQVSIPNLTETSCEDCKVWAEELQKLMRQYLCQGYAIVLEQQEVEALNKYLYLSELLIDSLQADIYCSKFLREDLLSAFMLPPTSDKISEALI